MGFTTGFLGGLTLTYSLVYLSIYIHRSNRTYQSLLLQQQIRLLNSKIDPPEPEYEVPSYRLERAGLEEQFKDGWNRTVASAVEKVQHVDWERVRVRTEEGVDRVWKRVRAATEEVKESGGGGVQAGGVGAQDPLAGKRLLDEK